MASTSEASQQANRSGLDPHRLVVIFYLLAVVVVGMFLANFLAPLFARMSLPNPELIEGSPESQLTSVLGFAVATAIAVGMYVHPRTKTLSMEVANELMKVTWPTWPETRGSTIAVIVASLVSAVVLFFIDTISYKVMVEWMPILWGKL